MSRREQRVALVCAGLDSTVGGYETHIRALFENATRDIDDVELVLFKTSGTSTPNEVRLWAPDRRSRAVAALRRLGRDRFFWESVLCALAFVIYVWVKRERFERVVVIEPFVRRTLHAMSRYLPGRPAIVWTHGVNNDPTGYIHDCDVVHEVNVENFERASTLPHRSASLVLLPHFCIDEEPTIDRETARQELGITTPHVLMCVGRIEAGTKRVDHIVAEAALLPDDWTLVLCGRPVDLDLLDHARSVLGERLKQIVVPRDRIRDVYVAADLLALGSLNEGFGLVLIEAMRAGVPPITHQRPSFSWITGAGGLQVDMEQRGALETSIRRLCDDPAALKQLSLAARSEYVARFSWESLQEGYAALLRGEQVENAPAEVANVAPASSSILRSRRRP